MKTVAIILARGGSKGVPHKNIRDIAGKPLISYSIETALDSFVDSVWVSTDCPNIGHVSEMFGASVLERPRELSTDESTSESALLHFSQHVDFDKMVFIQPTSPLLQPHHINGGLELSNQYDSVFSVYKELFLPRWSLDLNPVNFDNYNRDRRQDREDNYVENGAFYITTKTILQNTGVRVSGNIGVYEMSPFESFQIDTVEDFVFIERLM